MVIHLYKSIYKRVTENRNTSTMRSFKIFSRWCHLLFSISQFNSRNPNPKPNPKPNPNPNPNPNPKPNPNPNLKPNPNEMFEIRQSFKHPFQPVRSCTRILLCLVEVLRFSFSLSGIGITDTSLMKYRYRYRRYFL